MKRLRHAYRNALLWVRDLFCLEREIEVYERNVAAPKVDGGATKKNRVAEALIETKVGLYGVRVWVDINSDAPLAQIAAYSDLASIVAAVRAAGPDIAKIGEALEQRADVAAYQISGDRGVGIVVYPDWR